MSTVAELKAQMEALQKRIKEAEKEEQKGAINEVVAICKKHGISYAQLKDHLTKKRSKADAASDASS